ncbi:transcription initiation factor TFIID subunit 4-like [Amphibalanus amphitrite]|uniref:transcription initiation factor TFIID subunit 4-like n=1 Tax=Amphibalanus amphitrite TaxID=1232801 RepID=UPI001C912F9B|nr:transcription initiation factor TFIID subunit 4-like [Amphibalanus amphitrite]
MKMMGAVRKIPLSRSLDDFTDTAHMCSPHQPTPDRGRSRTPEPESSPQPCPNCRAGMAGGAVRAASPSPSAGRASGGAGRGPSPSPSAGHGAGRAPSPSPSAGRAAGQGLRQDLGARSGAVSPQFEFEMPSCSTATVSETRAVFDRRPGSPRSGTPVRSAPCTPSEPPPAPSYAAPGPAPVQPPPPVPTYNRFAGSSRSSSAAQRPPSVAAPPSAGNTVWGKRLATTSSAPAPFMQEMQNRGARQEDEDAPPFNFQVS